MITVFTPSYNRRKELEKLYESLLKQDKSNFEWLIVDDGSIDDTKEYIEKLKKEKKIKINYVHKENGGKQSAYNVGLDNAKGDIFLCIDSDDILVSNILSSIESDFKKIKKDETIAGIMYIQGFIDNPDKIIGSKFMHDGMIDNYFNIYNKQKVKGDKLIVLKTDIASKYPFPIIKGEKFVPEALIFNRISLDYNFVCYNKIAALKTYLDNGYSANYFSLVKRNPKGNRLYHKELLDIDNKLYNVYAYILFSFYSKVGFKTTLSEVKCKFKVLLLYIPTYIVYKIRG